MAVSPGLSQDSHWHRTCDLDARYQFLATPKQRHMLACDSPGRPASFLSFIEGAKPNQRLRYLR